MALRCDEGAPPALDVTQHRFRPVGSSAAEMQWITPACFRYRVDGKLGKECFEIANGTHRFALAAAKSCPDWAVGNAGGVGHYLTRYDAASLARIVDHFGDVPEEEAVAFAGDAALMARSGLLSNDQALVLAGALLRHPSDGVKEGGVVLLDKLRDDWLTPAQLQGQARADGAGPAAARAARGLGGAGERSAGDAGAARGAAAASRPATRRATRCACMPASSRCAGSRSTIRWPPTWWNRC